MKLKNPMLKNGNFSHVDKSAVTHKIILLNSQVQDEKEVIKMLAEELTLGASASDLIRRHSVTQSLSSGDHKSFQLDHDYIQRYLGKLTVMQESKLVQLRECMADLQKGKVSSLFFC